MRLKPYTGQLLLDERDDAKAVASLFSAVIENMDEVITQQGGQAAWHMLDVEVDEREERTVYEELTRTVPRVVYLTVPVAYMN